MLMLITLEVMAASNFLSPERVGFGLEEAAYFSHSSMSSMSVKVLQLLVHAISMANDKPIGGRNLRNTTRTKNFRTNTLKSFLKLCLAISWENFLDSKIYQKFAQQLCLMPSQPT